MEELETSLTPMVTPEGSPVSSLCSTPPEDLQASTLQIIDSSMKNHAILMERVLLKLEALKGRVRQEEDRQEEKGLMLQGRLESQSNDQKDRWVKNDRSWDEMRDQLKRFERLLQEDRADSAGGPRLCCQKLQDLISVGGPVMESIQNAGGGLSSAERILVNRKAEDEMRRGMDREASMLKTELKLSEGTSSS